MSRTQTLKDLYHIISTNMASRYLLVVWCYVGVVLGLIGEIGGIGEGELVSWWVTWYWVREDEIETCM